MKLSLGSITASSSCIKEVLLCTSYMRGSKVFTLPYAGKFKPMETGMHSTFRAGRVNVVLTYGHNALPSVSVFLEDGKKEKIG